MSNLLEIPLSSNLLRPSTTDRCHRSGCKTGKRGLQKLQQLKILVEKAIQVRIGKIYTPPSSFYLIRILKFNFHLLSTASKQFKGEKRKLKKDFARKLNKNKYFPFNNRNGFPHFFSFPHLILTDTIHQHFFASKAANN